MSYRLLVEEHISPDVVSECESRGMRAAHVAEELGAGADDTTIAAHAAENDYRVVTSDDDFLDPAAATAGVFFITDAEAGAHEIVNRVDERRSDVADPSALPDVVFLPA